MLPDLLARFLEAGRSTLSIVPDVLALLFVIPRDCNTARILLWTSWAWVIARNSHFRINRIDGGEEGMHRAIVDLRSVWGRVVFKSALLVGSYALTFADHLINFVAHNEVDSVALPRNGTMTARLETAYSTMTDPAARIRPLPTAAVAALVFNHFFWEVFELSLLANRGGRQTSISRFIANSRNKWTRGVLMGYTFFGVLPLVWWREGWICSVVFLFGAVLVLLVKTETHLQNGDEFQSYTHSFGVVVVLWVEIYALTKSDCLLWIVKFASVFPYFFQFISSIASHGALKMRSEIKMFKHLFDAAAVMLVY